MIRDILEPTTLNWRISVETSRLSKKLISIHHVDLTDSTIICGVLGQTPQEDESKTNFLLHLNYLHIMHKANLIYFTMIKIWKQQRNHGNQSLTF